MQVLVADRFEILSQLAQDALGVVVKVRDEQNGSLHALKIFRPRIVGAAARARFVEEHEALRTMSSPRIATVGDLNEADGIPWFTMQYVPGDDLRTWHTANRPAPGADGFSGYERFVIYLMRDLAESLVALHAAGYIHGRMTPDAFRVSQGVPPSLTLVSLARVRRPGVSSRADSGFVVGADAYVPPEKARGSMLTTAADLYGAGCILFECLTGRPPFTGETVIDVLVKHMESAPPDPRSLDPRIRDSVAQLCLALLAKQPALRPKSAKSLELAFAKLRN